MRTRQTNDNGEDAMFKLKLLLGCAITWLITLGWIIIPSYGQQFAGRDFLHGNQSIYLAAPTGGQTFFYYEVTNGFSNALGVGVSSLTNLVLTNGSAFDPDNGNTAGTPTYYTNANQSFGAQWDDVPLFSDRNGNAATASISISVIGATNAATSTNVLTFTFAKLGRFIVIQPDGTIGIAGTTITQSPTNALINYVTNNMPDTSAQGQWSFSMTITNGARSGVVTNIPSAITTGAAGLRLMTVVLGTNVSIASGYYVDQLRLNGYIP